MLSITNINSKTINDKVKSKLLQLQAVSAVEYFENRNANKSDIEIINKDMNEIKEDYRTVTTKEEHNKIVDKFNQNKGSVYKATMLGACNDLEADELLLKNIAKHIKNKASVQNLCLQMIENIKIRQGYLSKNFGIHIPMENTKEMLLEIVEGKRTFNNVDIINSIYEKTDFSIKGVDFNSIVKQYGKTFGTKTPHFQKLFRVNGVIMNNRHIENCPKIQMIKSDMIQSINNSQPKSELKRDVDALYQNFEERGKCQPINQAYINKGQRRVIQKPKMEEYIPETKEENKPQITVRKSIKSKKFKFK